MKNYKTQLNNNKIDMFTAQVLKLNRINNEALKQLIHEACVDIRPPQPVKKFSKEEIAELEFKMKKEGKL